MSLLPSIRREVAAVEKEGIHFDVLMGEQITPAVMKTMHQCYNANFQKQPATRKYQPPWHLSVF